MAWLWIWGPAVAQMAVIFMLSSLTGMPSLPGGLTDYTGHFIGYGLLGALATRAFARAEWRGVNTSAAWRAVVLASAYGVTDEVHQWFVPNRSATVQDWFADVAGAIAGAILVLLLAQLRTRGRESRAR